MISILGLLLHLIIFITKQINVVRVYLSRYSVLAHLLVLTFAGALLSYIKYNSFGHYFQEEMRMDSKYTYVIAGSAFLISTISFRVLYYIFRPTIHYGKYLIIHNIEDFSKAKDAFRLFVWSPLENRVFSKTFLIFILVVSIFYHEYMNGEIVWNLITIFSLIIIVKEVAMLIHFTFFPNRSIFSFLSKKSTILEESLLFDLLVFEKQHGFEYRKQSKLFQRKYKHSLSCYQKMLLQAKTLSPKVEDKSRYSNILFHFLRIKASYEFDLKFVNQKYFYRSFFLFFLLRVTLFFSWLTLVMCLLIYSLSMKNYLSFSCDIKNVGDVFYFWITSMGYRNFFGLLTSRLIS